VSTLRKVQADKPDSPAQAEQPARTGQLSSTTELRERARKSIEDGAVTTSYGADRAQVIKLLNTALATELVCVLRYRHHYYVAEGLPAEAIKQEFLEHANEEQQHADSLAERIIQLGGDPDFNPAGLAERSHAEYGKGTSLIEILRDDLIAERVAIQSYTEMIRYIGDDDPTTKRILEGILSAEEQHAEEISSLLAYLDQWRNGNHR
jgi:bacterioferritin